MYAKKQEIPHYMNGMLTLIFITQIIKVFSMDIYQNEEIKSYTIQRINYTKIRLYHKFLLLVILDVS